MITKWVVNIRYPTFAHFDYKMYIHFFNNKEYPHNILQGYGSYPIAKINQFVYYVYYENFFILKLQVSQIRLTLIL